MEPVLIITTGILFLSLILLLVQLYRQQKMYNTSKRCGIFKKEIVTLLAILTVFLFSFFLRIWWYYTFPKLEANIWMQSMPTLLLSIPFDFLPLLLMMILHYRNFRAKKLRKYDQITEEPDEILHLNLIENSPSGSA